MSKRVLCKFFAHGACLKGESCEYLHDWKAPPNNVCTFYQKGACAYGNRCRYDHIKASRLRPPALSTSADSSTKEFLSGTVTTSASPAVAIDSGCSSYGEPFDPPSMHAWGVSIGNLYAPESDDAGYAVGVDPADRPICSFAAAGECPYGIKCPHIHGDLCPSCKKHCLHPLRPQESEKHMKMCRKQQTYLEALAHSQEIECSVCLERVLSKPKVAERKFGILSECNHPFCISCIRNWRSSSPVYGLDVTSTLRSCPICRKLSYFVIPSVIWYSSDEEKEEIVENYKAKLKSIDCKYFNFANGTCPFGTSCFYKHAYRNGRLEEVALRHLGAEDGNTVIAKNIRLSDFLSNLEI